MIDQREQYLGWVTEAIKDINLAGDNIAYDLGLTVMPNQNGQIMPVYVLTLSMPTLVIGEQAQSMAILDGSAVNQRVLTQTVQESIEEMRKQIRESANIQTFPTHADFLSGARDTKDVPWKNLG